MDAVQPGSNRPSRVPRARCLRTNANRPRVGNTDAIAANDDVSVTSDDEIGITSVAMSEEPLFVGDEDGGMTDVQSIHSATTEPQTSGVREIEDLVARKRRHAFKR